MGKVSADEDGDLWFETAYTFADTLDRAALSDYLNWLDDTLFLMVDELGDYTS